MEYYGTGYDDQGHAQLVPRAIDKGRCQLLLSHFAHKTDDDGSKEEQPRHLGEPPPQRRQEGDAQILPGDDAVDHDEEGQAEQSQDYLAPGDEFGKFIDTDFRQEVLSVLETAKLSGGTTFSITFENTNPVPIKITERL